MSTDWTAETFVYVLDQEVSPKATVLGFSQNTTTGALTPTPGTVITTDSTGKTVATGYGAGTTPSAIAEDPSSRFVYITDEATNQLYGNVVSEQWLADADDQRARLRRESSRSESRSIRGASSCMLQTSPRARSGHMRSMQATGTPVGSVGSASTAVDTAPTCVTIEPALGIYLYTSNNLASDGFRAASSIRTMAD